MIIGFKLFAIHIYKTLGWLFKSLTEEFLKLTSPISLVIFFLEGTVTNPAI